MVDIILVVIALVILAAYFINRFVLKKQIANVTMEKEVKEAILSLFLYAEKQGWTGEAKMAFVAHKLHDYIPGKTLKAVLKEEQIMSYLQKVYDSLKNDLYK